MGTRNTNTRCVESMMRTRRRRSAMWALLVIVGSVLPLAWWLSTIRAQTSSPTGAPAQPSRRPVHITMEALHNHGGVPPGWQFTLPEGDPVAGREVFVAMQCYTCHTIAGEGFPPVKPAERVPAPELTGAGALHPTAYLAEAILNPSAVVVEGPGYADADGFSNMPNFADVLTVRQWLDLVAYLQSLGGPEGHHASPGHQQPHTGEHASPPSAKPMPQKERER
jgi:mono/diheme cytochrome c family protein